jgi:hypothetical protein
MNISKPGLRRKLLVGVLTAISLAIPTASNAQNLVESRTTVISACGKLFSIDSNAAGMSAEQRASIVQKNLDNALIAAKHRFPDTVKVSMMNRNPIVTVDNFYVVTADGNSAARAGMSQMGLAQKWADSIKFCLADANAINNYLSMLTGKYATTSSKETASLTINKDVAVAPAGMNFPIQLSNALALDAARVGDTIQGVLSTDVPLGPNFTSYLPAGTVALGQLIPAAPFNPNNFAGKNALTIAFYAFRTPDGKDIPIHGHIYGGVDSWHYVSVNPIVPNCCGDTKTKVELRQPDGNIQTVSLTGVKGEIGGAWRGLPVDQLTAEGFHRMLLTDNSGMIIPAGAPMFLQLNATTTIAVNTATSARTTNMVSSVGIGM